LPGPEGPTGTFNLGGNIVAGGLTATSLSLSGDLQLTNNYPISDVNSIGFTYSQVVPNFSTLTITSDSPGINFYSINGILPGVYAISYYIGYLSITSPNPCYVQISCAQENLTKNFLANATSANLPLHAFGTFFYSSSSTFNLTIQAGLNCVGDASVPTVNFGSYVMAVRIA
jgi:hypothetical protein